ncbi:MAG: glycosyltransferase family 2 protein [Odoribacter sp.]
MEVFFSDMNIQDTLFELLTLLDNILYPFYAIAVGYLLIFAIGANIKKRQTYLLAKKNYRYAVLFYVDNKQIQIIKSVKSFLEQDYPDYRVMVVSNAYQPTVKEQLAEMPVDVFISDVKCYNKAKAIQYALSYIDSALYDVIVIMDSDSEVDAGFLSAINNAYYQGGMAIQTHRITKNLDSDIAIFGAVSEEINNSIFRHGHVNFGFSSALIGSGMAFKLNWLKENIEGVTNNDFEKQLEFRLLEQFVFVEYLNDVHVYCEKKSRADEYYKERSTWQTSSKQSFLFLFRKFFIALSHGNYDLCDKIFQWLIPSRMIIVGTLLLIAVGLLFVVWGMALKWWLLLLLLITAFSIALPDYLIDARFIKALRGAPILFLLTVFNSLKRKLLLHEKMIEQ